MKRIITGMGMAVVCLLLLSPASAQTVTDIDGNVYTIVKIGKQSWMAENLRTTRYRNGDSIAHLTDDNRWSEATGGAWSNYRNLSSFDSLYGKLYNWYAVNDKRGLCPKGWHVATDADWNYLTELLGGKTAAGAIKSPRLWDPPNRGAMDKNGFSAFGGGLRNYYGMFKTLGTFGYYWSSTGTDRGTAWFRKLDCYDAKLGRDDVLKETGFSCRCVMDSAQMAGSPEEITRKVADNVIRNTSFNFINKNTKEKYASTRDLPVSADITTESPYNKWEYVNGVLAIGMMQLARTLNDDKYADYSLRNFKFIFSNRTYFEKLYKDGVKAEWAALYGMQNLDACGAMAAGLSDVNALSAGKDYQSYLDRAADYISNKQLRLPDGTLSRPQPRNMTLWADDLYMSVPFLARMGKRTGNPKYFDDAIRQVISFNRYLYDTATGLYFHCYYSAQDHNGVARWGRCNGWIAMAQVELLSNLPANHPARKQLTELLLRQIIGFSRYQDISGLWRQVLDRPDSYLETSVTAMFTYAVAKAVNEGWIPQNYMSIAKDGWEGLVSRITENGEVKDVCIGTGIADNIRFYLTRPARLNDAHALGAVLLAGTEMIKAARK